MPTSSRARRARYSQDLKQQVRLRYPHCRTLADRRELAQELGIGSVQKLYNLASRLGVTQRQGEAFADHNHVQEAQAVALDPQRLQLREDPGSCEFTDRDDAYLRRHFGRLPLGVIAFQRNHTEVAMAYRARRLGVRGFAHYYELQHVVAWLSISAPQLRARGVAVHPCCNRRGEVTAVLVSTLDLARAVMRDGWWRELSAGGADRFFLGELIESAAADAGAFEEDIWVSHGHTCLCPFAGLSYGLFYRGDDPKLTQMIGTGLTPEDLHPRRIHLLL